MKKIIFILIAVTLLITIPASAMADDCRNPEVICKTVKGSDKYMTWELQIPHITKLENRSVEKSINKQLSDTVLKFKKELHAEAKNAYKDSKKSGYPFRKFDCRTVYEVHFLSPELLSLTIDFYQYTGGAHGFTVKRAYNFNLKTGKEITYKDIFKNCVDYKTIIINHVISEIEKNPQDYFYPEAIETVKGFTDQQPFYITKGGIVVYYGLYEIAPYASGIREFFIPFSAFKCE